MNKTLTRSTIILLVVATMSGCAGMTRRQQNTAVGAAIGGVAGSILTNGDTFGTLGGAAIGGFIGHGSK